MIRGRVYAMRKVEVTLYSRADCSLCDKARAAIRDSGVPASIVEVDIDADPALRRQYTNDVPVIFVDGVEAFRHRLTPQAFADYVSGRSAAATTLAAESCVPCRGGVPPLKGESLVALLAELGDGWCVIDEHHLQKSYRFPDFAKALALTVKIGAIAEREGHHPDLLLRWGELRVEIWTHAIDGLTRSDFVLAAKIEAAALSSQGSR
jgi:4a-hydroxytetrahydrobiopterin dehydratase